MATYRIKGQKVTAKQWFKHGDHELVKTGPMGTALSKDGKTCGWIEGIGPRGTSRIVEPGDFIVQHEDGFLAVMPEAQFFEFHEEIT